jgi:hypothetical protein
VPSLERRIECKKKKGIMKKTKETGQKKRSKKSIGADLNLKAVM